MDPYIGGGCKTIYRCKSISKRTALFARKSPSLACPDKQVARQPLQPVCVYHPLTKYVYEETLKVEYQPTALALYSLIMASDHEQIAEVRQARRIQTPFRSPQLALWQLSETEWLLALRRPDPALRRNRGKIVALARQLPLLDVNATG